MDEQTTETKVMKAWRLHPDIVQAIEDGHKNCGYPNETAYIEAVFRRVYGLPDPPTPKPKPPRVKKKALALRA
jgi:hypothetical protein